MFTQHMRSNRWLLLLAGASVFAITSSAAAQNRAQARMTLTSNEIRAGQRMTSRQVYNSFGCTGENISPQLSWTGAPADTKSFAITVYDPDAPTGSGWWHWMVYNIPANTTSLASGAGDSKKSLLPAGAVQGPTDFGAAGWGGPCPPAGDRAHRYIFTVFALKVPKLDIPAGGTSALVGFNLNGNMLAKATLTVTYGR